MLRTFRTKLKFWSNIALWPVIIAFVAFYGWSFSGSQRGGTNAAAIVNEIQISRQDVMKMRERLYSYYRNIYKDNFDRMAKNIDFQQQALDKLISDIILIQTAEDIGLAVSKQEIQNTIAATSYFQKDGQFSPSRYNYSLRRMRLTSVQYEQSIAQDILLSKVQAIIGSVAPATEDELRETYQERSLKLNCEFYKFSARDYIDKIEITDTDTKNYFTEHSEEFRIGDQIKLKYIKFDPKNFEDKVDLFPDDIDDYYNKNIDNYHQTEQVKASHILLKVDQETTPEDSENILKKAQQIKKRLDNGEDFETLAKELSEGPSAEKGGDLGFFEKNRMVKEFADAVWDLDIGSITDPVKTRFGYHIIKKTDYKAEGYQTFEEVDEDIQQILKREESKQLAKEKAQDLFETTDISTKIDDLASNHKLEINTTDYFENGSFPRELGRSQEMGDILFNLDTEVISIPVETFQGIFLFAVAEKKEPHIPDLENIRDKVSNIAKNSKALEHAKKQSELLLSDIQNGKSWDKVGDDFKSKLETTGDFSQSGYIPKLGSDKELVDKLFEMEIGSLSAVEEIGNNFAVFKIISKIEFNEEEFMQELPTLRKQLLSSRQQQAVNSFISQRKAKLQSDGKLQILLTQEDTNS